MGKQKEIIRRVLNLGAGTQSSVLYLMMCERSIPPAEVAIFSDTQWEPKDVYVHLKWLAGVKYERWADAAGRERYRAKPGTYKGRGVPVVVVTAGDIRADAIAFRQNRVSEGGERKRYASIPLFVMNPDGSQGIIRRQCTKEYKIAPIVRWVKANMLGLAAGQRVPPGTIVAQVFGISFDERQRMSAPRDAWSRHEYPLVDMKMRRQGVIDWAERRYPKRVFPRSACIGCPYHSNAEWRRLRDIDPAAYADAVRFDEEIRAADHAGQAERERLRGVPYVHRSLKPLGEVNVDGDGPGLWDGVADNDCTGMCGS